MTRTMCLRLITTIVSMFLFTGNVHSQELSQNDKECLTRALYHEARGEPDRGIFAVASVILNRVQTEGYPEDVCGVVNQRGQFTFDKKKKMTEYSALVKVRSILDAIQQGFTPNHSFLYFHRKDVIGPCTNHRRVTIGNHVFCD